MMIKLKFLVAILYLHVMVAIDQTDTITIKYSQWCQNSLKVRKQFKDVVSKNFPQILLREVDTSRLQSDKQLLEQGDTEFRGIPVITFHKEGHHQEYKFDLQQSDMRYFIRLFFYNQLPHWTSTTQPIIPSLMKKSPNVVLFYGDPGLHESTYQQFVLNAHKHILYDFYLIDPRQCPTFHQEMFMTNYLINKVYIILRRRDDQYDMIMVYEEQFQTEFDDFMEAYSNPYSLRQLNLRTLEYLKQKSHIVVIHLITADYYQFNKQITQFDQTALQYRRSKHIYAHKPIFIRSDVTGQTKSLLYRHLQKSLIDTPLLVSYQLSSGFKFKIYQQKVDDQRFLFGQKQWIDNLVQGGIQQSQVPDTKPFAALNQQHLQTVGRNIIHDQYILRDIFFKQKRNIIQLQIVLLVVTQNCKPCLKLYALLSQARIQSSVTLVVAQNTINIPEIQNLISNNSTLLPQLYYVWTEEVTLEYKMIKWESFQSDELIEQIEFTYNEIDDL